MYKVGDKVKLIRVPTKEEREEWNLRSDWWVYDIKDYIGVVGEIVDLTPFYKGVSPNLRVSDWIGVKYPISIKEFNSNIINNKEFVCINIYLLDNRKNKLNRLLSE